MDIFGIINYVLQYLNGFSESAILAIIIFVDALFATKGTKTQGNHTTSGKATEGFFVNIMLAFTPTIITLLGYASSLIPYHEAVGDTTLYVFDAIAAAAFIYIGNFFLKSLMANYKLMGGDDPQDMVLGKWIKGEVEQKFEKRSN